MLWSVTQFRKSAKRIDEFDRHKLSNWGINSVYTCLIGVLSIYNILSANGVTKINIEIEESLAIKASSLVSGFKLSAIILVLETTNNTN